MRPIHLLQLLAASTLVCAAHASTYVVDPAGGPGVDFTQIRAAVNADTHKPFTNADFEAGVNGLRGIAAGRAANVASQVP